MPARLAGKRVFVTGAGQGIGRAIVLAFADEGAEVVAASRTVAKMADLPAFSPAITPVGVDATDGPAIADAIRTAGRIDVLVNCVGWVHNGTILDTSDDEWAQSIDQNATSTFRTIRAVLPGMIDRGSGSIVNVASVASCITGVANRAAYGASKAAVIGLTKAVARDVVGFGIRCNALCPGTTDTPSLNERIAATVDPEATRRQFIARQAMGRFGKPSELAAAALFLASEESGFATGIVLPVDGGQTL